MRDHTQHIELSREAAVDGIMKALPSTFVQPRIEKVSLYDSFGRILAQEVGAKTDIPNVLTCRLDSVAVHWRDFTGLPDGRLPDTAEWVHGVDWEFANTGVAMPEGFDTAIVVEHVKVSDDEQHITILAAPSEQFAGTRDVGSQKRSGEKIADAGLLITPDVAAQIAGAGHSVVSVIAKPHVAFIPTGNELVPPNLPFAQEDLTKYAGRGKVYESNSAVVKGKVEEWGGVFVPFDIVPDEPEAIREAVQTACKVADIVVLNAGSSKGSDDWSVEVLEEMGQIICHQTNHGPGHHSSYALVKGVPIVGISGPRVGASFTLNFYLLPLIKKFLGLDLKPMLIPAYVAKDFPRTKMSKRANESNRETSGEQRPLEATEEGAEFYSVCFLSLDVTPDGMLTATPVVGGQGTPETQHANAYYMMPSGPGLTPPKVGDIIQVELRGAFNNEYRDRRLLKKTL